MTNLNILELGLDFWVEFRHFGSSSKSVTKVDFGGGFRAGPRLLISDCACAVAWGFDYQIWALLGNQRLSLFFIRRRWFSLSKSRKELHFLGHRSIDPQKNSIRNFGSQISRKCNFSNLFRKILPVTNLFPIRTYFSFFLQVSPMEFNKLIIIIWRHVAAELVRNFSFSGMQQAAAAAVRVQ